MQLISPPLIHLSRLCASTFVFSIMNTHLGKYTSQLFITLQSNVISDNIMSKFILTLTKQVPDKQYAHLCNKETSETLKCEVQNSRLYRAYIMLRNVLQKEMLQYFFFTSEMFSFRHHIFYLKRFRRTRNCITYFEESILSKPFKIGSLDKRQSLTGYTFSLCLVIGVTILTTKFACLSIFLKIRTLNFMMSYEKIQVKNIDGSIISAKVDYSV